MLRRLLGLAPVLICLAAVARGQEGFSLFTSDFPPEEFAARRAAVYKAIGPGGQALNHGAQKSLKGSRILLLGVAYKADIEDERESPAEKLMHLLQNAGSKVAYHDPHVPSFQGLTSVELRPEDYDCVVIVTAHSAIDYAEVVERSHVVVDFRNATGELGAASPKVWKL